MCEYTPSSKNLLGASVLGDGLGAFRDGVLGQFTGEEKPDGGLDLPGGDGGPLVVVGQTGSLSSDTFKDIVDKGVHDAHGLGGDTSVGVDLFQDLVDVDGVGFFPFLVPLLAITLGDGLLGLAGLLGSLSGGFGGHVDTMGCSVKLMVGPCLGLLYMGNRALVLRIDVFWRGKVFGGRNFGARARFEGWKLNRDVEQDRGKCAPIWRAPAQQYIFWIFLLDIKCWNTIIYYDIKS